jgi:hypothetical protein
LTDAKGASALERELVTRPSSVAECGDALQSRGEIDAVPHQIAVALLNDVAQINADTELDAALARQAGVSLDHAVPHLDGAARGVHHAAKLNESAVAGALDDAPAMRVDGEIDQVAPQPPEPRQRAILVRSRETAVSDNVRDQDPRDFPGLRHGAPSRAMQNCTKTGQSRPPHENLEKLVQSKFLGLITR